jgi:hypothetical protein
VLDELELELLELDELELELLELEELELLDVRPALEELDELELDELELELEELELEELELDERPELDELELEELELELELEELELEELEEEVELEVVLATGRSKYPFNQRPGAVKSASTQGPDKGAVGSKIDEASSLLPSDQLIQLKPFWFIKSIHCCATAISLREVPTSDEPHSDTKIASPAFMAVCTLFFIVLMSWVAA